MVNTRAGSKKVEDRVEIKKQTPKTTRRLVPSKGVKKLKKLQVGKKKHTSKTTITVDLNKYSRPFTKPTEYVMCLRCKKHVSLCESGPRVHDHRFHPKEKQAKGKREAKNLLTIRKKNLNAEPISKQAPNIDESLVTENQEPIVVVPSAGPPCVSPVTNPIIRRPSQLTRKFIKASGARLSQTSQIDPLYFRVKKIDCQNDPNQNSDPNLKSALSIQRLEALTKRIQVAKQHVDADSYDDVRRIFNLATASLNDYFKNSRSRLENANAEKQAKDIGHNEPEQSVECQSL